MVFEKVRDILVDQLDVEEEKVTMEASVTEDLGADSLDFVDLVMSLEEEFDVEIPDDQVENIKTVVTGGLGRIIANETDAVDIYDPNLTLKGINLVYKKQNRKIK